MDNVTNEQLFGVLMDIKEDIGGLKTATALQLTGLQGHSMRLGVLEGAHERQKGAVKVWGLVATAFATIAGGAVEWLRH